MLDDKTQLSELSEEEMDIFAESINDVIKEERNTSDKSRVAAGIFAIFLGTIGVHDFYLGFTFRGILKIIMTLSGYLLVISAIWSFIDGVLLLTGSRDKDSNGAILKP